MTRYYYEQSIPHRLVFAREAIHLAQQDPALKQQLERFGYTPERCAEGSLLIRAAESLLSDQQLEYGARLRATDRVKILDETVRDRLRDDRHIARIVFRGRAGLLTQLRVIGRVERARVRLIHQATHFYRESMGMEEVMNVLRAFSLTSEVFLSRLERVEALAAAMEVQQRQRAEAKVRTKQFRTAMDVLDGWMGQFIGVARQAFKEEPRHLEKLGVAVKIR